jgi:hypothetical protein
MQPVWSAAEYGIDGANQTPVPEVAAAPAGLRLLEHDPEKWRPVFRKDHAPSEYLDPDPIQLNWIRV